MSPRPVLLLIFNRPDTTAQVLQAISTWDISTLYIAADGARGDRTQEAALCETTRNLALELSSHHQVVTLFREENLGCGRAVAEAISWFFSNEEAGIILEDDCVPNSDFYNFCDQLLDHHADDEKVMMISGNNFLWERQISPNTYIFSRYNHIWGWATWRRAWKHFEWEMSEWPTLRETSWLFDVCHGQRDSERYWRRTFDSVFSQQIDTWDYKWTYSVWRQQALSVTPPSNLVDNIGFFTDATHTLARPEWLDRLRTEPLSFPLNPANDIVADLEAERFTDINIFNVHPPLHRRARTLVGRALRKLHLISTP